MNDNEVEKFEIRIDEESPDSQFQDDVDELKAVKLNRRITRTSILIIMLMGAIILIAYIDLKKNLSKMSSSGDMEIHTLSKGMQSQFSSFSSRQAKLEEVFAEKIVSVEKAVDSMQTNLKEISTAIKHIRSARNSDNKKTADAIEAINKTLVSVPQKLEHLASDVNQVKQKYADELSRLSRMTTNIQQNIQKLQADLDALSSSQLDKKTLDIKLSNERNLLQKSMDRFKNDMGNELIAIKKKIKALEKITESLERSRPITPKASLPSQQIEPKPVDENTHTQPGTITEQDIQ